ncbi:MULTISPECIES: hypothetical protein [Pseudanabaena]|uniref:Beta-lactamase inhibitor (BLIP) n=2 Tax=Pseudanabaena TaxID=1152 RepID=L8MZH2_9CYAN|nr:MULTISPECIES: hypothetical protein [Pseudanabaena]ELS32891.1 hypothetical protein Pse7429DRAFT_1802 [Pseudanabaena biceps PCC 7429]MDG3494861.1 hypothetical protein [Pseudanabaena catenata USMAC16]
MLSIAELAHKRNPEAIAKIIYQELQCLDIDRLNIDVDIVDSSLEVQIRTDSALDKEQLLTIVRNGLQELHIESIAKFKIHCWRNDEEMHEQRPLWTEQFMLDLPKSSLLGLESNLEAPLSPTTGTPTTSLPENQSSETRAPETQLSKQSVLQQAISKIAPTSPQAKQPAVANSEKPSLEKPSLEKPSLDEHFPRSSIVLANPKEGKSQANISYWQLLLVGLSIVLLGLGIGASVRALTSKIATENGSAPANPSQVMDTTKNTGTGNPNAIAETPNPNSPKVAKANGSLTDEPISANAIPQQEEQVITLEKFNRIQKGMSVEQVDKIFGISGKVIAENSSSNGNGKVYSWKNSQGSNAIVEFKDGQVVAKAQAGL